MPKKDKFHEVVKSTLVQEKWHITNDPLYVPTKGGNNFFIDLGAERILGAEKDGQSIAVEIKSFDGSSPMYTFYEILGQFLIYKIALREQSKPWKLYIALSDVGFKKLDDSPIFNKAMQEYEMKFIIVNEKSQTVVEWRE